MHLCKMRSGRLRPHGVPCFSALFQENVLRLVVQEGTNVFFTGNAGTGVKRSLPAKFQPTVFALGIMPLPGRYGSAQVSICIKGLPAYHRQSCWHCCRIASSTSTAWPLLPRVLVTPSPLLDPLAYSASFLLPSFLI